MPATTSAATRASNRMGVVSSFRALDYENQKPFPRAVLRSYLSWEAAWRRQGGPLFPAHFDERWPLRRTASRRNWSPTWEITQPSVRRIQSSVDLLHCVQSSRDHDHWKRDSARRTRRIRLG